MKTAHDITVALVCYHFSPFALRRQFCCCPRVSWGLGLSYEADLIVCSKAGFLTEVEIKISTSDWRQDAGKDKWRRANNLIKCFYYAAPEKIVAKFGTATPWAPHAGIFAVRPDGTVKMVKECQPNTKAVKLSDSRRLKLAQLIGFRYWDGLQKKSIKLPKSKTQPVVEFRLKPIFK